MTLFPLFLFAFFLLVLQNVLSKKRLRADEGSRSERCEDPGGVLGSGRFGEFRALRAGPVSVLGESGAVGGGGWVEGFDWAAWYVHRNPTLLWVWAWEGKEEGGWTRRADFRVISFVGLDVAGAPGSQNGQDNSGLTGPVQFKANATNVDRSLAVLRNLTAEFTQAQYGGVVTGESIPSVPLSQGGVGREMDVSSSHTRRTLIFPCSGISLLNEPRLDGSNFTMLKLKEFYTQASQITLDAAVSGVEVVIHGSLFQLHSTVPR